MNLDKGPLITSSLVALVATRSAVVFAVMAAAYFVIAHSSAPLAMLGLVGLHTIWRLNILFREGREAPRHSIKVSLLLLAYSSAVPVIATGLLVVTSLTWLLWAYDPFVLTARLVAYGPTAITVITAVFIVLPLAFLIFAPIAARNSSGVASRFLQGVRAQGLERFCRIWLSNTAFVTGILITSYSAGAAAVLRTYGLWRGHDNIVTTFELLSIYPTLPLLLAFSAVMLAIAWSFEAGANEASSLFEAYTAGTPGRSRPNGNDRRALGALAICGYVASMLCLLYPTHNILVAEGAKRGASSVRGVAEALKTLTKQARSGDWSGTRVVAELNRLGFWTPEAPDEGLATLVANPAEFFNNACTVRMTVKLIDRVDKETTSGLVPEESGSPVRHCTVVTCASPVRWNAPRSLILYSSHTSKSEYWLGRAYIDFLGEGRAPEPGGYCTADGALADSYQG